MLGGLSMTEIIIILGLALLLLGPDQLPSLAKSLGKGLRELRKATDDIKGQFESEIARIDLDQQPQKSIAPVPPPDAPKDEGAKALEPPANPADDPAAARAAARRAAAESQLKLVPEGSVPRQPEAPPAAAEEPKA
ncbi:MAG TPA: twin-arginine translocase TatA/TatE family subunit [Myxococcales bacterium]